MNQEFFEEKLDELVRELGSLPDPAHQKLVQIAHQKQPSFPSGIFGLSSCERQISHV